MKKRFALVGTMALCAGSISAIQVDEKGRDISSPTETERETIERNIGGGACCFEKSNFCVFVYDGWSKCEAGDGSGVFYLGQTCEEIGCGPKEEACDEWTIFDNVAKQLTIEVCGGVDINYQLYGDIDPGDKVDLDQDGTHEGHIQRAEAWASMNGDALSFAGMATRWGEATGSIRVASILDLMPFHDGGQMIYEGFEGLNTGDLYYIGLQNYWDVTGDGLPDAIISMSLSQVSYYFYIENISTTTTACASDTTGDGVVNVDDLIAMIADWGACP